MAVSGIVPGFRPDGHLPQGRYRVDMAQAYDLLVGHERFATSRTRGPLWDGLTSYLLMFEGLQERYAELVDGRELISLLWLAGSYVSAKLDPGDIDVTVFTNAEVVDLIKGKPGAKWLMDAFHREKMGEKYKLDPFQVSYRAVPHAFNVTGMTPLEAGYFRDRGRYDDWWQRLHPSDTVDKQAPTMDSCMAARGYLEVTL
ncbi:DUF6932 family protein [Actinomadura chokoriensis]|uniref:DUF6932 family protein n=1 Tax=Actinomadura chokoriensis TaxID=454156 RepID=UPI0031F89FC7